MGRADAVRFGALALQAGGGGVSTYVRELLKELAPRLSAGHELSALVQRSAVSELPGSVAPMVVDDNHGVVRAIRGKLPSANIDLFHSLDVDLPVFGPAKKVATVHDLSVFDAPWAFSKFRALGERALIRDTLRRADILIAVSDFTAERIKALSGRDAVVSLLAPASWARKPDPASIAAVRKKYSLPAKFVLQVGTYEPRKRPDLVIDVASRLGIPCLLAGKGTRDVRRQRSSAIGLGYVPVTDLPALYAAATVVTYASVYEGFGLPPVEAMACGAAVVASAVGALPQVVGDGAVLVTKLDLDKWTRAIRPLIDDRHSRAELQGRAVKCAAQLSWRRTAELTVESYGLGGATT